MVKSMSFRSVSLAASVLYIALFACLLFTPGLVYLLFGIERHLTADLLARRAAMLFLGLAVLSYLGRNAPSSGLRRAVSIAMATAMAGLMCSGMYEYFSGTAGIGIWSAIGGEAVFLGLYLLVLYRDISSPNRPIDKMRQALLFGHPLPKRAP
jgi:O-antigen/teichoic acid export membrane protein